MPSCGLVAPRSQGVLPSAKRISQKLRVGPAMVAPKSYILAARDTDYFRSRTAGQPETRGDRARDRRAPGGDRVRRDGLGQDDADPEDPAGDGPGRGSRQ